VVDRRGRRTRKLVQRENVAETEPTRSPDCRGLTFVSLRFGEATSASGSARACGRSARGQWIHVWPRSVSDLVEAQRALVAADPKPWRPTSDAPLVGACAVRSPRGETAPGAGDEAMWAAAAVLRGQHVLAEAVESSGAGAAYAAGLLALREGPLLEAALRALAVLPDVVLVEATGRDHPRRAGLALHLGAIVALPTIGVTHRPLLAEGGWPDDVAGAASPLSLDGEVVGAWVRTRAGARPVAVHAAWRTDADVAIALVVASARGYRTPEPLRHARRLARVARLQSKFDGGG
jgi:deoxyribonuclease V